MVSRTAALASGVDRLPFANVGPAMLLEMIADYARALATFTGRGSGASKVVITP